MAESEVWKLHPLSIFVWGKCQQTDDSGYRKWAVYLKEQFEHGATAMDQLVTVGDEKQHNTAASRRLFLLLCLRFKPAEQQKKNPLRHMEVLQEHAYTHTMTVHRRTWGLGVKLKTVKTNELKRL